MPVIADGLRGKIYIRSGTVEDAGLVAEFTLDESMHLHAKVKPRADVRCDGIERMWKNDRGSQ